MARLNGAYMAYPIDNADTVAMRDIYDAVNLAKEELIGNGVVDWVFDPGDAFTVSGNPSSDDVARINNVARYRADITMAWLPAGVQSVGVPMEVDRSASEGKVVAVFSDLNSWMLQPAAIRARTWDAETVIEVCGLVAGSTPKEWSGPRLDDLPVVLGPNGVLPQRAHQDDAGYDLVVSEDTWIPRGEFVDVPCDLSMALPDWAWGLVTGRSSALRKRDLLVHSGIIDAGYRGPIYAGAFNVGTGPVRVRKGERIAQLIVMRNFSNQVRMVQRLELPKSERGTGGFGSTGA